LHHSIGTNSRLDELQAAVLRVKLKYLEEWNRKRQAHADLYRRELSGLPLVLPKVDSGNFHTYHQFVIRTAVRDRLRSVLAEKGIGTAIYYPVPLPLQPCFSDLGHKAGEFPHAEEVSAGCLALPVYPELTQQQLGHVINTIRNFFHG
jgi:dTDP-4-amino-4,6-dideoxygalactose transaminase